MNFTGILIAISAFLIIGLFHPIVIKTEYYTGVRFWWIFLLMGLICLVYALYEKTDCPRLSSLFQIQTSTH